MADSLRNDYVEYLAEKQDTDTIKTLAKKTEYEPIFTPRTIQPEEEPDFDAVNKNIAEMYLDIQELTEKLSASGSSFGDLKDTVAVRLKDIQKKLDYENERLQDTNMICGNISEFTTIKRINASVFSGALSYSDDGNTIFCPCSGLENTDYTILDIAGNGYSGNAYVKPTNAANTEWPDTSDPERIKDSSMDTAFEYSRLETSDSSEKIDSLIHYDTEPVRCTIELYTESQATMLQIDTKDTDIILEDLQVSNDGIYFTKAIKKEAPIFNREYSYNNYQYIYGSGTLSFKPSKYIRITLRSNAKTDDVIYNQDKDDKPIIPNTRRKVIRLNQITLSNADFSTLDITSNEVIQKGTISSIALFSNIYIPNNFKKGSYITMELIVNGTALPIVPINSDDTGIKIIRYGTKYAEINNSYVQYISEPISSVKLHITMQPYNTVQSPFLSNLKFCIGKESDMIVH